jgi:predicted nucleic acid-binding protein
MSRLVILDAGPLGMIAHPRRDPTVVRWFRALEGGGITFAVAEVADYEVRRELLRANLTVNLARLDVVKSDLLYLPITTDIMLRAAAFWAQVRHQGVPAARLPGLTRLGHVVYAAGDPRLLELLVARGITVECSLSSNVVLGAVPSYEAHPIRRFLDAGIPVALGTDDPAQLCTTIGREYAIAAALGFSHRDLLGFTDHAIRAAFTTEERRAALLEEVRAASRRVEPGDRAGV